MICLIIGGCFIGGGCKGMLSAYSGRRRKLSHHTGDRYDLTNV